MIKNIAFRQVNQRSDFTAIWLCALIAIYGWASPLQAQDDLMTTPAIEAEQHDLFTAEPQVLMDEHIDLADAVAIAVTRHPDIAHALAAQARGRADLANARAVWMPSVGYSANLGPHMFNSNNNTHLNQNMQGPSVALNQLVWDFGRSSSDINAASSIERQRHFELSATADQVAETTALSYLNITRSAMMHQEAERQLQELERLRELIKLRSKAGISDKSDLKLADVRIEGAKADLIQAEADMAAAKADLINIIGITPTQFDNPSVILSQFNEDIGTPDFDSLPIVASAKESENASSARIEYARAERYPRIGIQLGYNHNNYSYDSRDNAFTAVVTVHGNLYNAGTSHKIEAAQQDRQAAIAGREALILEIKGRMNVAREAIRGGVARIDIYKKQEETAISARDIFIEEYKLGKRSLFDLLNAEQEIYRAASARVMAQIDVMRARVQLYSAYGILRSSLVPDTHIAKAQSHD